MRGWQWRNVSFAVIIATFVFSEFVVGASSSGLPALVTIPAGRFKPFWLSPTGKNRNNKTREINVKQFQAMVYAVTMGEYNEFLLTHPEWSKAQISPLFAEESYLGNLTSTPLSLKAPVTAVSWFAAKAYCESLQMRLPTTNEWEYIAAASEKKVDANSDQKFLRRILDWYGEPQGTGFKDVGSIYKNMYGVWDMHGLIWEWVDDFNSIFVTGESREDSSFNKDLFCGSGSMNGANKQDYAAFMRFAFRSSLKGRSSIWNLGFRCVR